MKKKLTPKQERFCHEYIIDLNATQAAIRSGYSKRTSYSIGQQLLKKVEIQSKIQELNKAREKQTGVTAEKVIRELALVAFSDFKHFVEISEGGELSIKQFDKLPEGMTRIIKSIEEKRTIVEDGSGEGEKMIAIDKLKYVLHDKLKSLDLLGRHLGLFVDPPSALTGKIIVELIRENQDAS